LTEMFSYFCWPQPQTRRAEPQGGGPRGQRRLARWWWWVGRRAVVPQTKCRRHPQHRDTPPQTAVTETRKQQPPQRSFATPTCLRLRRNRPREKPWHAAGSRAALYRAPRPRPRPPGQNAPAPPSPQPLPLRRSAVCVQAAALPVRRLRRRAPVRGMAAPCAIPAPHSTAAPARPPGPTPPRPPGTAAGSRDCGTVGGPL